MRLKIRQMIMLMAAGFMGLSLSSCSKGESNQEYQKPVEFSGYTARSVTKAGASFATGTELPAGQPFGVYAYNTGRRTDFKSNPDTIATYGKFMTNVPVTYNGDGASVPTNYPYVYRYWPNDETNNHLAFFAYYPHGTGTGITQSGFADFSFTVQDDPANQVDFMLSDVVPGKVYSNTTPTGVVNLSFNHMLTQVRFKGQTDATDGVTVKINELKLMNVINSGTLTPNVAAASSEWTVGSTTKTYEISLKDMKLSSEAAAIAEDNQTLLMVPQTLTSDCKLSVKYTIKVESSGLEITQTALLDLSAATVNVWEKRQQIVYTLNIGLHLIEFSADVDDWSYGYNGAINV